MVARMMSAEPIFPVNGNQNLYFKSKWEHLVCWWMKKPKVDIQGLEQLLVNIKPLNMN